MLSTSSPGRFSLALGAGRPGDEVEMLYVSQVLVALWMCDMIFRVLPLKAKYKNLDFLCL